MPDSAVKAAVVEIDDDALRAWPLPLPAEGDKEDRGRVVVVAGCAEIPGAAVLAATAALRAGAGKVTIATPASIAGRMAFAVPESRVIALEEHPKAASPPASPMRSRSLRTKPTRSSPVPDSRTAGRPAT